ncbi:hypothetical protein BVRB_7g159380 [Beta vulgaris subsp. vulgaris]|uniref:uncharacterized protein LOC104898354 n=1 Tax=Beta vulgaris subsp. vulgaris TaxID=3555 RepID=UPI00053FACD7|nr:uncharacterized protein LOC104898354 [Beta vulgaris subsp. vulgaris]KMT06779.1 hypothetical protein BVRB_7g159380 [Beta vulgaris subsp. vulgaris]
MGCVSSKLLKKNLKQELLFGNGDLPNHVVSLTSSTYGVLKLENQNKTHVISPTSFINQTIKKKDTNEEEKSVQKTEENGTKVGVFVSKSSQCQEELEVINTWELMEDLIEEIPNSNQMNKSTISTSIRGGCGEKGERSPFKRLINQVSSPKGVKKVDGKENRGVQSNWVNIGVDTTKRQQCYSTPRSGLLKSWKFSSNSTNKLRKASSFESPRRSNAGVSSSSRRRSLGPLFDPELIDSLEKELSQENEQIKEMLSPKQAKPSIKIRCFSRNSPNSSSILLKNYVEKCPPGGENCVVMYTTTLRGIRKTFEHCNAVRSVIESYHIRVIERDVSMDSGFKEELRKLMGTKEVKVPLVFVKGRLIGGAEDVVKLEEEGKLEGLFQGIPKALSMCEGCGGIRFVMCMDCNGSCKVLDENNKNMVRCGECNENGLIHCPICCNEN